ncbi:NaeI family type II restriction endonuclease [Streptomyces sp. NBC_01429]
MLPFDVTASLNIQTQGFLEDDPELAAVYQRLRQLDPDGMRFSIVLRDTIDQLLNGEATGRYDWKTLFKTEKTHAGTLVEINLQREFNFDDGTHMDYRIENIEVDCKYSQKFGGWMIPPEAMDHLCLLVWADDYQNCWSAGILRIRKEWLNAGNNRDLKLTVRAEHRDKILWLWNRAPLPRNILLHMPDQDREAVFSQNSGQARLNELFRRVQRQRISRNTVRTIAQQKDYMKRVRGNGGARSALQREGILIMGDYESHKRIASGLGIPVPRTGEFVSTRVKRLPESTEITKSVIIDGQRWAPASDTDPVQPAPTLPSTK